MTRVPNGSAAVGPSLQNVVVRSQHGLRVCWLDVDDDGLISVPASPRSSSRVPHLSDRVSFLSSY